MKQLSAMILACSYFFISSGFKGKPFILGEPRVVQFLWKGVRISSMRKGWRLRLLRHLISTGRHPGVSGSGLCDIPQVVGSRIPQRRGSPADKGAQGCPVMSDSKLSSRVSRPSIRQVCVRVIHQVGDGN